MSERAPVLIVDDDALILRIIERALYPYFDITTAGNLKAAQTVLAGGQAFAAIVSDLRMPGGDGVELLQYARARHPDTIRILFSGNVQVKDARTAINDGQVFRLLTKPFELASMRQALDAAVVQNRLITSERVLLEETLKGSIKALTDMLAIVQPLAFGRAIRMRQHASELAESIEMTRRWDVEVAALLSQIGCVTLDAGTLDRWYHNRELTPYERAQVDRLPEIAEALIANIPRLDTVRAILRRQHEPFHAKDLPTGAAILAIVRDYDVLIAEGNDAEGAFAKMEGRNDVYGAELMMHFRTLRMSATSGEIVREMPLNQISESMIFAADVYSANELLLIARGQSVTPALLSRLRMQSFAREASLTVRMIVNANSTSTNGFDAPESWMRSVAMRGAGAPADER